MLVYGDDSERVDPHRELLRIREELGSGFLDHDGLTAAFIDLAGVTQGVADAHFREAAADGYRPDEATLLAQLVPLALQLFRSWESGCIGAPGTSLTIPPGLPDEVEVRVPEGYAFYALAPEGYGLAARQLCLRAPPRIIGLRSIGTGLACMAAAALGSARPVTLRPVGDPFRRELRIAPELADALLAGEAHYVIVDEGPGLSGSSFGAVADWLEDRGVAPERISFLPGHGNAPGPQASERHRTRWAAAQKPAVALDRPHLPTIEALVGPLSQPLQDISGGAWRPLWSAAEQQWPAVDPMWERRKFLARTASGTWLVKFAGLGRIGRSKLALARDLHRAGFGPEVAGLKQGWLVSRWHEDAVATRPNTTELLAYLRLRASWPAAQPGAPLETLLAMVRRNLPSLADWTPDLSRLQPKPVCTDNRMAAYEWLRLPSGQLLKADALDHHAAHDLIGCQDIAWDLAGAAVELSLEDRQTRALADSLDADPALLAFYRTAYIAFRVGAHRLSAGALGHWPQEQRRNLQAAERLEALLPSVDAVEHAGHVH